MDALTQGIAIGLTRQVRVITALTIREVRLRNSKHAFSQLFDVLEAIVFIVVHWIIFTFMHRQLLIGDSLLLFISTGIFPVLFFRTMSMKAAAAVEASKSVTSIPYIEPLDYSIARTFVEFLSFSLLFTFFFAMIAVCNESRFAIPSNPIPILHFFTIITLFSFGMGLVNSFITYLFPLWKFIYAFVSRVQIFFSAVFYIPEYMPPQLKYWLSFNPIMHIVAVFRTAFYPTYPTHLLSLPYAYSCAAGVVLLGLALERALRNHRHQ